MCGMCVQTVSTPVSETGARKKFYAEVHVSVSLEHRTQQKQERICLLHQCRWKEPSPQSLISTNVSWHEYAHRNNKSMQ